MTYAVDLFPVALVTGILFLGSHLYALLNPRGVMDWLRKFPRSQFWGRGLLLAAAVWCVLLLRTMDLGEFAGLRFWMIVGVMVLAVLTDWYVREFLAVRALGILLLLGAEVLLCAAFLRPEVGRLLLVVLAYGWIVAGMVFVGVPWVLRDAIEYVTGGVVRMRVAAGAGALYGLALAVCALFFFRQ